MGHPKQILDSSKTVTVGLLKSVAALANLCGKYTQKLVRKALRPSNKHILGTTTQKDFGVGGLWQRSILMGEKCEPLDFSGVIYYDSNGNYLSHPPVKSPRPISR